MATAEKCPYCGKPTAKARDAALVAFCQTPKTAREIMAQFQISETTAHAALSRLYRSGRLRGSGRPGLGRGKGRAPRRYVWPA